MSEEQTNPPTEVVNITETDKKMGSGSIDWKWMGETSKELVNSIKTGFLDNDASPRLVVVRVENSESSFLGSEKGVDDKKVMGTLMASENLEPGTFLILSSGGKGVKPIVSKIRISESIYVDGQFSREQRQGGIVYFTEGGDATVAAPILGVEEISADEASVIDPKIKVEIEKKTGVADKPMTIGGERITDEMLKALQDDN